MTEPARTREDRVKQSARAYLAARANATLDRAMPTPAPLPPDGPRLVSDDATTRDVRAWEEAVEQVRKAKEALALPAEAYLRYPLPWLDQLVGGVRPNRVHYYVSASNNGKTLFVRSFIENAVAQGQSCAVMTTETSPHDFRTSLAVASLGLHPGDIATGTHKLWPNAAEIEIQLGEEMDRWIDYEHGTHQRLRVSRSDGFLTPEKVRQEAREAADRGLDWLLIDHVDHVEASSRLSEAQMSNAVNVAIWRAAVDLDLRIICTSQLNQEVFRQNNLGLCLPPEESWVKFGTKKKEICWVMLTGNRPLRKFDSEDERKTEIAAYRAGQRTIRDITIPALQVRVMKHRDYGERVGASCLLEVKDGRLTAPTRDTLGDVHGIATHKRTLG